MALRIDSLVLSSLTIATAALAVAMCATGNATILEGVSFVTGALCVWLTVRESVWNFPISLANVVTFCIVFFHARLFADASLQVVYFVLTLIGWYWWLFGGERRSPLRISRASAAELATMLGAVVVLTGALWYLLRLIGGSTTFYDALTTALSLCAQWLLNRKRFENWYFWIAADLVYVPLYAYKSLYLTAGLYAVFLCMCVIGLRGWSASMRRDQINRPRNAEAVDAAEAIS